jgi:hypothetical protein
LTGRPLDTTVSDMTNNDAIIKLRGLREEKVALVSKYEIEANHIAREIELLRSGLTMLDQAIKLISETKPDTGTQALNLEIPATPSRTAKPVFTGLQDAVQSIIDREGNPPGIYVLDILSKLKESGYAGGRELYSSIYTTCVRLERKGKITSTNRDGKKAFMKKPKM